MCVCVSKTNIVKCLLKHVANDVSNADADCLEQPVWNFLVQLFIDWFQCHLTTISSNKQCVQIGKCVLL